MPNQELAYLLKNLPEQSGVYRYYNKDNILIYVGKAKNLKNRVLNYFQNTSRLDKKTQRLVSQIHRLDYTIVATEFDALILENNLIKENQPKYNILLRDDKTYPYLVITKERFPRLITTRNIDKNLGTYYGPYTSGKAMYNVLEFTNKLLQLRNCQYKLSEENISANKYQVCLEYQIKNCLGPCERKQTEENYNKKIEQAHHILKGNLATVKAYFTNEMNKAAEKLNFEEAQYWKEKFDSLNLFHHNQIVIDPKNEHLSVFAFANNDDYVVVTYFKIIKGTIIQSVNQDIKIKLADDIDNIAQTTIYHLLNKFEDNTKEIITNLDEFYYSNKKIKTSRPIIGDKHKILNIALKNAKHRLLQISDLAREKNSDRILKQLKEDLKLKELPIHIECFDNSNFQGTDAVSAMVCFKQGKPSKKDYRIYNVKSVEGPDDFSTMKEVVYRRYKRLTEENKPLPQLIIIDGGKGQLSSAIFALKELDLYGKITIIGIAKNLEEIFFPGDQYPIYLNKKSESLKLIQHARDEAHRFGITRHRNKRSKTSIKSNLDKIEGIGPVTKEKLLKHFKTIRNIKECPIEEIASIIGQQKAEIIVNYFK